MATSDKNRKKSSPTKKTNSGNKNTAENVKKSDGISVEAEIILICLIVFSLLLFLSNFGLIGAVGRFLSNFLYGVFGIMAYVFPIVLLFGSIFAVSNMKNKNAIMKLCFVLAIFLFVCIFISLISRGNAIGSAGDEFKAGFYQRKGGGCLGALFTGFLVPALGLVGSYIITLSGIVIFVILLTKKSLYSFMDKRRRKMMESSRDAAERRRVHRQEVKAERAVRELEQEKEKKVNRRDRKVEGVALNTTIVPPADPVSDNMSEFHVSGSWVEQNPLPIRTAPEEPEQAVTEEPKKRIRNPRQSAETIAQQANETAQEIHNNEASVTTQSGGNSEYVYPPVRLLTKGVGKRSGDSNQSLRETAIKLEETMRNFGVRATVTNVTCGPSVTRYEIQPDQGVKVSKIVNLADDIKLNLAAADIRIEAPIPGKAAVGIEVPNKENVTVMLRDLIESEEFAASSTKIPFTAGKDIAGNNIIFDIGKMPHVLIAGSTGSGKSVCINTIVMSILYKARPDEVKLIMIDPKVVELSVYNGIPHLMIPVVTEPKKAAGALHWAVAEMTERYNKFAEYNVRDLKGFNEEMKKLKQSGKENVPDVMPQIVIIVDELADLMMVAPGDVEDAICRLAQLARAAGIHLILATQRPSVNVITGLIKANMPSRVAFAVSSGVDSRTILDMNGAEKLLGKGDMLFYPQGYQKPLRVQGAFVSDKEVADVVDFLKKECPNSGFDSKVEEKLANISIGNGSGGMQDFRGDDDGRDAYFAEAGRMLIEKERGSIGMLQRVLKIGFNRAARIMDQLEDAGVVGPEEGTKPRKILMSMEEFNQMIMEE